MDLIYILSRMGFKTNPFFVLFCFCFWLCLDLKITEGKGKGKSEKVWRRKKNVRLRKFCLTCRKNGQNLFFFLFFTFFYPLPTIYVEKKLRILSESYII